MELEERTDIDPERRIEGRMEQVIVQGKAVTQRTIHFQRSVDDMVQDDHRQQCEELPAAVRLRRLRAATGGAGLSARPHSTLIHAAVGARPGVAELGLMVSRTSLSIAPALRHASRQLPWNLLLALLLLLLRLLGRLRTLLLRLLGRLRQSWSMTNWTRCSCKRHLRWSTTKRRLRSVGLSYTTRRRLRSVGLSWSTTKRRLRSAWTRCILLLQGGLLVQVRPRATHLILHTVTRNGPIEANLWTTIVLLPLLLLPQSRSILLPPLPPLPRLPRLELFYCHYYCSNLAVR